MQAGFTVLEAGSVKASSLQNILFKNLMDACCGGIISIYYFVLKCVDVNWYA